MKHFICKNLLIISSIVIVFLDIKCDNDDGYVDEKGFEINGIVLDSASQLPIQEVIVGFTHYPDSIVIVNDSINTNYLYPHFTTDDLGKFRWSGIGSIGMEEFHKMVAWKKEYKLWRYADEPVPIDEIKENSYELTIYLLKK